MPSYTLSQIAEAIGADAVGNVDAVVTSVAEPAQATADQLALAMKPDYAAGLKDSAARVAVLWAGADWASYGLDGAILPRRPRYAMSGLTGLFDPGQGYAPGIHPSAVIDPTAELAEDVWVGPNTVIGAGAVIGAGSVIGPLCSIGAGARIGEKAFLRDQVSIGARVRIGDRFIAQPGARIGGDGFSFVTPDTSGVENVRETLGDQGGAQGQSYARIQSLGSVRIGDDVEIGANATIDSGTIRDTVIGDGCKFDNLTHAGHNVVMGKDCLVCGQTGIAGSVTIGNNVVFAGQTGINDNIFIGDNVITGGGSIILSNVPAGRVVLGYPATKMDTQLEIYKAIRRLPRIVRDVAALQKAVFKRGTND